MIKKNLTWSNGIFLLKVAGWGNDSAGQVLATQAGGLCSHPSICKAWAWAPACNPDTVTNWRALLPLLEVDPSCLKFCEIPGWLPFSSEPVKTLLQHWVTWPWIWNLKQSHEPCSVLLPGGILQVSHDHQDVETTAHRRVCLYGQGHTPYGMPLTVRAHSCLSGILPAVHGPRTWDRWIP